MRKGSGPSSIRLDLFLDPGLRPSSRCDPTRKERTLDDKLNRLLHDLGKALSELIAESPDVTDTLDEIHREGYRLSLLVDCSPDSEGSESSEDTEDSDGFVTHEGLEISEVEFVAQIDSLDSSDSEIETESEQAPVRRRIEPMFQINSGDLAFFRSIGIDPTQKLKKRRST